MDADRLPQPNVKTDGLLPFMINRLRNCECAIRNADHQVRFAVARGPLNIASFLMGTTEFMMALALDPDGSHKLLQENHRFYLRLALMAERVLPVDKRRSYPG